jgi:hypothetical protein
VLYLFRRFNSKYMNQRASASVLLKADMQLKKDIAILFHYIVMVMVACA